MTLDRLDGGVDSTFSLEPQELNALVVETKRVWEALGEVQYGPTTAETASLKYRRSLYIAKDVKRGDVLTTENLRCVRPGLGLSPKFYELLLGKAVRTNLEAGTPVQWEHIIYGND